MTKDHKACALVIRRRLKFIPLAISRVCGDTNCPHFINSTGWTDVQLPNLMDLDLNPVLSSTQTDEILCFVKASFVLPNKQMIQLLIVLFKQMKLTKNQLNNIFFTIYYMLLKYIEML